MSEFEGEGVNFSVLTGENPPFHITADVLTQACWGEVAFK